MRRRAGRIAIGVVLTLGAVAAYETLAPRATPPRNLILISIDTLRADHLGTYGYARDTSPSIDRLARRSVVFEQAVAQAPTTLPSHAVLLTSRYWSATGSTEQFPPIPEDWVTLAEILGTHGFKTWGFVDGGYMGRPFGFAQGFQHYDARSLHVAAILENVETWLDSHAPKRFFLFVHCYDVHSPYQPRPPFNAIFDDPEYKGTFEPTTKDLEDVVQHRRTLTPEELRHVVALYDGGIRYTDEQLGRFFDELERRGLLDSSVLVLVSDHGEEFLEHGSLLHWQMHYTPNLHVPFIFHVPGVAPVAIGQPVELTDFVPTVLDLLGLPPHAAAMGRTLAPLIKGSVAPYARPAYAESFSARIPWRTVITDRYQFFRNLDTGEETLFDIRADPGAKNNLVQREPATTAGLRAVLEERQREVARVKSGAALPSSTTVPLDGATRDQLRALGYVQ